MPGQDSILQLKVIVYEFRNGVPFALYNMHTLACMHKYTITHTHTPLPMQWIDKICTPTASKEAWQ